MRKSIVTLAAAALAGSITAGAVSAAPNGEAIEDVLVPWHPGGVWASCRMALPDTLILPDDVLVVSGRVEHIEAFAAEHGG